MTDLEGTARQHPAAFLGTTFAAGLAAGRFLRASSSTDTGLSSTAERGVDFEFHPDAALLADDTTGTESFGGSTGGLGSTGGYAASGSTGGFGSTNELGSSAGPGSTGATGETFGSRLGETPAGGYSAGASSTTTGHVGTGGAAMASRAAGSAPIGSGTGGLNEGGAIGDDLRARDESAESSPERRDRGEGEL